MIDKDVQGIVEVRQQRQLLQHMQALTAGEELADERRVLSTCNGVESLGQTSTPAADTNMEIVLEGEHAEMLTK